MKSSVCILVLFFGMSFLSPTDHLPKNLPKFIDATINWDEIKTSKLAFNFANPDTLISHEMHLLSGENGLPLLYYADILTPVCIDGLCKPVYAEMYWDLLGQYIGYGEFPNEVLSKFDHEDFETNDYEKLHQLLLDENSVLGKRELSSLYDISQERKVAITFKGVEVDGVSGATKKEIKTAIVDGALYSCYTLWQLANGNAQSKIKEYLPKIYDDTLKENFLNSTYETYQFYALKALPKTEYATHIEEVVSILLHGKSLTRAYGLKKMPTELFRHPIVVKKLFSNISKLDFNARTLLIDRLKYSVPSAALVLMEEINHMSKNQLKSFLETIKNNKEFQSQDIVQSLSDFTLKENYPYNYLITDHIENMN